MNSKTTNLDIRGCRILAAMMIHRAILDLRASDQARANEAREWLATDQAADLADAVDVGDPFADFVANGMDVERLPRQAFIRKVWV